MADNRSEASKYKSRYSPDTYVTTSQYAAELVCECIAFHNKEGLPSAFWNLPKWTKTFVYQKSLADKLLKQNESKVLIDGIKACIAARVKLFSLRNKLLKPYLVPKVTENKEIAEPFIVPKIEQPRAPFGSKPKLDI